MKYILCFTLFFSFSSCLSECRKELVNKPIEEEIEGFLEKVRDGIINEPIPLFYKEVSRAQILELLSEKFDRYKGGNFIHALVHESSREPNREADENRRSLNFKDIMDQICKKTECYSRDLSLRKSERGEWKKIVDFKNNDGDSPLHLALNNLNCEAYGTLLRMKASRGIKNEKGEDIREVALRLSLNTRNNADREKLEYIQYTLGTNGAFNGLQEALLEGNMRLFSLLFEKIEKFLKSEVDIKHFFKAFIKCSDNVDIFKDKFEIENRRIVVERHLERFAILSAIHKRKNIFKFLFEMGPFGAGGYENIKPKSSGHDILSFNRDLVRDTFGIEPWAELENDFDRSILYYILALYFEELELLLPLERYIKLLPTSEELNPFETTLGVGLVVCSKISSKRSVEYLLPKIEESLNARSYGSLALAWAEYNKDEEMEEILKKVGFNFRRENNDGHCPFTYMLAHGPLRMAEWIYREKGMRLNNRIEEPLLWGFCRRGIDLSKMFELEEEVDFNITSFPSAMNSLHICASGVNDNVDLVRYLLNAGLNVNRVSARRRTALHYACIRGHYGIAELLLENGVDINRKDNNGKTSLHMSASNGDFSMIKLLLSKGANPNLQSSYGETPLILAIKGGREEGVKALLSSKDLDVNLQDSFMTPIEYAIISGETIIFKYLINDDRITIPQREDGKTLLMLASINGVEKIIPSLIFHIGAVLMERGTLLEGSIYSYFNKKDESGATALILSIKNNNEGAVNALLNYEDICDVNLSDNYGKTALMWSAEGGNNNILNALIEKGATIDLQDNEGETPLIKAVKVGNLINVLSLLENNGSIDHILRRSQNGKTAKDWARSEFRTEIYTILENYENQ